MFRMFEFCFLFCWGGWILLSVDSLSLLCLERLTMQCIRFSSIFSIWFLTFENQELVFVTVFLTLCPYSSSSSFYHASFVLAPTFIQLILIFSVKKLNDFGLLDFRHFFGLQLISSNIKQYWEFASQHFPKLSLITIFCNFLPALELFWNDFLPLNIILLLCLFYDYFNFWISMKSCCLAYVQ